MDGRAKTSVALAGQRFNPVGYRVPAARGLASVLVRTALVADRSPTPGIWRWIRRRHSGSQRPTRRHASSRGHRPLQRDRLSGQRPRCPDAAASPARPPRSATRRPLHPRYRPLIDADTTFCVITGYLVKISRDGGVTWTQAKRLSSYLQRGIQLAVLRVDDGRQRRYRRPRLQTWINHCNLHHLGGGDAPNPSLCA